MGTAASAVYLGTPQGALYWAVPRWETQQLLCQSERAGGGYVLSAVKELAEKEGITETLKAENQMLWVQRMNAVRETATEIVNNELIYA